MLLSNFDVLVIYPAFFASSIVIRAELFATIRHSMTSFAFSPLILNAVYSILIVSPE